MVKPKFGHRDAEVESLIIEPAHSLSLFPTPVLRGCAQQRWLRWSESST